MHKSTVIARCLVNSNMMTSLEEAEHAIRVIFDEGFPGRNFDDWNQNLNDTTADNIVKNVDRASRINVEKFIEDL